MKTIIATLWHVKYFLLGRLKNEPRDRRLRLKRTSLVPARGLIQGENEKLMEKMENIIMIGEDFLKALQLLDAKSLSEKELLELDDLKGYYRPGY